MAAIDKARAALQEHPRAVLLPQAHTDTVAQARTNVPLSRRRAQVVLDALLREGGAALARVFVDEPPEAALPKLTAQETDEDGNRVVSMRRVVGR